MHSDLLQEFINEWFAHPSWWFSSTPEDDQYLSLKYDVLCFNPIPNDTLVDKLRGILIHDQLIRHIVRHHKLDKSIIQEHLNKAIQFSYQVIEEAQCIQNEKLTKGTLSWKEWCFTMLPFRHQQHIPLIEEIIDCIWHTLQYDKTLTEAPLLQRFLKATYQRFPIKTIQKAKREREHWNQYKTICDYMPNHLEPQDFHLIRSSTIGKLFKDVEEPILVSLSGGVDSMVCIMALKAWNKQIGAIHINYDNRPECQQEQKLVEDWCSYLDIPCWFRRITEIHRESCMKMGMRDLYESYTKTVRFTTYHQSWDALGETEVPKVILGHHLDDCLENTLTNIISCTKYNDLFGMEYKRFQDGVWMIRPLLSVHKNEILDFAHQFQIPYLKDSTPEWSLRGQLRDSVVPTLKQWIGNQKLTTGFKELNQTCQEMAHIIQYSVSDWKTKFKFVEPNKWSSLQNILELPKSKIFYREFFIQMWRIFPSHRSIVEFLSRISKLEEKWNKIQINVNIHCTITKTVSIQWIKRSTTQVEWNWILQS